MNLYIIGFGILGMFTMGCGLMQPGAAPVGSATLTSASADDNALLPTRHRPTIAADRTDPYDGTHIPSWPAVSDKSDPWSSEPEVK